jgi:hypothetical protein
MKPTMKKTLLAAALGLTFNAVTPAAHASLVLTFTDSTAVAAKPGACSGIAWTAGAEFRMCDPTGTQLGFGAPLQRNAIFGGETYSFNDTNLMTGVTGTPGNVGTTIAGTSSFPGSAAPMANTNPSWQQNVFFGGPAFNLLAPITGSLASAAYGPGTYVGGVPTTGTNVPFIFVPVLEAQWGGTWFPLGASSGGVTFIADISNVMTVGSTTTFDFHLFANECIDGEMAAGCSAGGGGEDPGNVGFSGWTFQWHQQGSGVYTAPVPIPAAVWLFGSGLLGLVSLARRKKAT